MIFSCKMHSEIFTNNYIEKLSNKLHVKKTKIYRVYNKHDDENDSLYTFYITNPF